MLILISSNRDEHISENFDNLLSAQCFSNLFECTYTKFCSNQMSLNDNFQFQFRLTNLCACHFTPYIRGSRLAKVNFWLHYWMHLLQVIVKQRYWDHANQCWNSWHSYTDKCHQFQIPAFLLPFFFVHILPVKYLILIKINNKILRCA